MFTGCRQTVKKSIGGFHTAHLGLQIVCHGIKGGTGKSCRTSRRGVRRHLKGSAVLDAWWGRRRQEVGAKMGQGFLESAC